MGAAGRKTLCVVSPVHACSLRASRCMLRSTIPAVIARANNGRMQALSPPPRCMGAASCLSMVSPPHRGRRACAPAVASMCLHSAVGTLRNAPIHATATARAATDQSRCCTANGGMWTGMSQGVADALQSGQDHHTPFALHRTAAPSPHPHPSPGASQSTTNPTHLPTHPRPTPQGKDAIKFLEGLVVGDIAGLKDGTGSLSVFTNEKGGIIDDTVVTKVGGGGGGKGGGRGGKSCAVAPDDGGNGVQDAAWQRTRQAC